MVGHMFDSLKIVIPKKLSCYVFD